MPRSPNSLGAEVEYRKKKSGESSDDGLKLETAHVTIL
jgi:hypothetical protein